MTDVYSRVSQLVPAATYAAYKTIETTVLGSTLENECGTSQTALLWVSVSLFFIICLVTTLLADGNVAFNTNVAIQIAKCPVWIQNIFSPIAIHALLSCIALLSLIFFAPVTFSCLFGSQVDAVTTRSVPMITGIVALSAYTILFTLQSPAPAPVAV